MASISARRFDGYRVDLRVPVPVAGADGAGEGSALAPRLGTVDVDLDLGWVLRRDTECSLWLWCLFHPGPWMVSHASECLDFPLDFDVDFDRPHAS